MRRTLGDEGDLFFRKLSTGFKLSEQERAALAALPTQITIFRGGQDVIRQGDQPTRSFVLLDGFTISSKVLKSGKRQIVGIDVAGDFPDLQSLYLTTLGVTISTLMPSRLGFIPHEAIHELCQDYPRIGTALWRETLVNAAIFREWVTIIGQQDGLSRLAHLLCELVLRLRAVGLAQEDRCSFPLTQAQMGEAVGLSSVHVNRSLQELRSKRLIRLAGKRLEVLNWNGLMAAADFDDAYLQVRQSRSANWPWSASS